jgi:CBS domain-containing protein
MLCIMEITGTVEAVLKVKGNAAWFVTLEDTVFSAIELMAQKNVGALLVMSGGKVVGVVSERDYTRKVALLGKSSKQTLVKEVISGRLFSVSPATTVEACLELMTEQRIRHLPVLVGERVVGVVSIGDLVNWIIHAQQAAISQLQSYISGQYTG